ncbi:mitochondrial matrix Mmp37 [Blastocladiella britannica]|nr:mitochondrial matrix Mmp37 [Blastocladiella britannica]
MRWQLLVRNASSSTAAQQLVTKEPTTPKIDLTAASPRAQSLLPLLANFKAPIRFAFAYGSAVFEQVGARADQQKMVDLVFGVTHPHHWHSINMHQHPHHYSRSMRALGAASVATLQDAPWAGAGVHYNPYVEIDGVLVKYGVVSINRLERDLDRWESCYLAGRMHKPIQVLRHDSRISLAQWNNLAYAARAALLLLTPSPLTSELSYEIPARDLYTMVAGLSYRGDFRMAFKYLENPHKVRNMVAAQEPYFHHIYGPVLSGSESLFNSNDAIAYDADKNVWVVGNLSPRTRAGWLLGLPPTISARIRHAHRGGAADVDVGVSGPRGQAAIDEMTEISQSPLLPVHLNAALYQTIARPALLQSVKGIFTAGVGKSIKYAASKIGKGITASTK